MATASDPPIRRMMRPAEASVRLTCGRVRLIYGIGFGLWVTGVCWLVFHYFLQIRTTFETSENPLAHWWLVAHAFFGFAAVWLFGLLWGQHIVSAWKAGRHRVSGGLLFALLVLLIASGYLLYYIGGDEARMVISQAHWITGLILPLPFLLHRFMKALAL